MTRAQQSPPGVAERTVEEEHGFHITAGTRLFALLGDPVSHSRSPVMQNAAFRAADVDGVYLALRCSASDVAGLIAGVAHADGGGNVTIPHKGTAAAALERPTDAVLATGACNTFWLESGRICGDNTDVYGFRVAVEALLGSCSGIRALILGAGGASRAAAVALAAGHAARIEVLNRSAERAHKMRLDLASAVPGLRVIEETAVSRDAFDLVVNATSLGLRPGDPLPLDLHKVYRAGAVLDLVCSPGGTAWTQHALAAGVPAAEGTTMLVAQGAAAFERWWRVPAPFEVMHAAIGSAQ